MEEETKTTEETEERTEEVQPFISFSTKKEFQDAIDERLGERLAREKRKAEEKEERAKVEARAEALKDQEKYKELSETQAQTIAEKDRRISELEGLEGERDSWKEKYEGLQERFGKMMEGRLSVVADPYKPLLERMSVEERADWLEENAEKIAQSKPSGSAPTPPAASGKARNEQQDKEVATRSQRATASVL